MQPRMRANKKATRWVASLLQLAGLGSEKSFTWHRPIFSGGYPPNIVGAAAFHNRVRDGSEWFHCAMDTRIGFLLSQVEP
jgi:hypothetical protein